MFHAFFSNIKRPNAVFKLATFVVVERKDEECNVYLKVTKVNDTRLTNKSLKIPLFSDNEFSEWGCVKDQDQRQVAEYFARGWTPYDLEYDIHQNKFTQASQNTINQLRYQINTAGGTFIDQEEHNQNPNCSAPSMIGPTVIAIRTLNNGPYAVLPKTTVDRLIEIDSDPEAISIFGARFSK